MRITMEWVIDEEVVQGLEPSGILESLGGEVAANVAKEWLVK